MSPRERVETVALLKSIARGRTMIIIDHDMDLLFELVERVTVLQEGRVLVEGTPEEIKINPKVQEAYLGGVQGEAAMSLLEVDGLNAYYGDSHILFDVALRVEKHEVVALAREERRRQEHDPQEPHGHCRQAHRHHQARRGGARR